MLSKRHFIHPVLKSCILQRKPSMKTFPLLLFLVLSLSQLGLAQDSDTPIITKSIFFGGGSFYIDARQAGELRELIESLQNPEFYQILVHGHTDDIGSVEYNQWLSDMRTNEVIQKIIATGIPPEIISEQDFGELSPVYDNNTWEGKLKNRRVDIIFKKPES